MINSVKLVNAIFSASNNLKNNRDLVDDLNIFPVPDGDTGTNMSMTMDSACSELKKISFSNLPLCSVLEIASSALLRGARGNSGVILSLLFKGICEGLKDKNECDSAQFVDAFRIGVDAAYKAVMNPTEGTILTVARLAYEQGHKAAALNSDEIYVVTAMLEGANRALEMSPDLLPVLKKAKVVDAGGQGLCLILEGMLSVFKDGVVILEEKRTDFVPELAEENKIFSDSTVSGFEHDGIKFAYCTEFMIHKNQEESEAADYLREYLAEIGDCVLVVDNGEIVKVHVHSNNPDLALGKALEFGELTKVKIENMKEQNRKRLSEPTGLSAVVRNDSNSSLKVSPAYEDFPPKEFGFVAVASGEGIKNLFRNLGCSEVVEGGQTMNPSTNNIADAIKSVSANTVFVFPNNKNILLAAEQATKLVKEKRVHIVPSKTISQGVCALLAFSEDKTDNENFSEMVKSAENVQTGQITFASRDAEFGRLRVKKGDIIALADGKLVCKSKNVDKAAMKLLHGMIKSSTSFLTLFYGQNVTTDEAKRLFGLLQNKYGKRVEISLVNGGQPVYHYIISVE